MIDPYVFGLIGTALAAGAAALFRKAERGQIVRTMGAVALCWAIGTAYIQTSHDWDPWAFNILLDSATAMAIMWRPASNAQGYVGALCCVQIAMHIGYGIRQWAGLPTDRWAYYDGLTFVAWCQLLVIAGWAGGLLIGRALLHRYRPRAAARAGGHRSGHSGETR